MSLTIDDTIAAIASPPGGAARGIVRVSGPGAIECVAARFVADDGRSLSELRSPSIVAGQFDVGGYCGQVPTLLYVWPTKRSYTRQVSVELHLPGSSPILDAALATLVRHGARVARPGEFTLRAFLAGRMDLTQAEAVLGVIDAESTTQLQTALHQLSGGLATPLQRLRSDLLDLLAHLEAGLDFVEEDIEFISQTDLCQQLAAAARQVAALAEQMQSRGQSREEPRIVLIGHPNAGKSSLLNALAGESAAIVSAVAGTTRDYVTRTISIEGIDCSLIDTAGVDQAAEASIEAAAQDVARGQRQQADVVVLCLDATAPRTEWENSQLAEDRDNLIIAWTKIDRASPSMSKDLHGEAIATSSVTGQGLDLLKREIADRLQRQRGETHVVAGTAARCRESLQLAAEALRRAEEAAAAQAGEELVAAEVRGALDDLGRVVGAIYTDDVLDRIFSRFCIGK
jgi:tRNA modification GTPase